MDASNAAITEAHALQKLYRARRMRWARNIGRPVKGHESEPFPGVLDLADEEAG